MFGGAMKAHILYDSPINERRIKANLDQKQLYQAITNAVASELGISNLDNAYLCISVGRSDTEGYYANVTINIPIEEGE